MTKAGQLVATVAKNRPELKSQIAEHFPSPKIHFRGGFPFRGQYRAAVFCGNPRTINELGPFRRLATTYQRYKHTNTHNP